MRIINIAMAVLTMLGAALVYSAMARAQSSLCTVNGTVTTCSDSGGNMTVCVRNGNIITCM